MKAAFTFLLLLLLSAKTFATSSIKIGEDNYVLANKTETKEGSLREFVRPGETLGNWTTLVGVRICSNLKSPKEYIVNMAKEYKRRYPLNQFAMFENHKTGGWILDYIIFPPQMTEGIIEWDYFEAVKNTAGEGIIVNQFAARRKVVGSTKETMKSWNLGAYRDSILSVLMTSNFPIIESQPASVSPTKSGD